MESALASGILFLLPFWLLKYRHYFNDTLSVREGVVPMPNDREVSTKTQLSEQATTPPTGAAGAHRALSAGAPTDRPDADDAAGPNQWDRDDTA